jgi:hypothetical protein
MFRALLAHPHELLHKQHSVYCMCVTSVGCTEIRGERHYTKHIKYTIWNSFQYLYNFTLKFKTLEKSLVQRISSTPLLGNLLKLVGKCLM